MPIENSEPIYKLWDENVFPNTFPTKEFMLTPNILLIILALLYCANATAKSVLKK